jgi:hypothetical protein
MFIVIGILFFLAWLATFFFFVIGHILTYIFLFLAIIFIIVHFVLMFRRRSAGRTEL